MAKGNIIRLGVMAVVVIGIIILANGVLGGGGTDKISNINTASSNTSKQLEGNDLVVLVLDKVKAAVPTVEQTRVVTEDTDANNLIGKQGEYQYAGSFYDTRTGYKPLDDNLNPIDIKYDNYGLSAGGTIEVFATEGDAIKRGEYLGQFQTGPISAGPYKVVGKAVLRVSRDYKASEQQEMLNTMQSALE